MALGGAEFTERRAQAARLRFRSAADVGHFMGGLIVLVLGALILADSVVGAVSGTPLIFSGMNSGFEFAVGFIAIVLGAAQVPQPK